MPAASSASRIASATVTFAAWCRPRRPTRIRPSRGSSTVSPSRSVARMGAGSTTVSGTPIRRARRRTTASASPVAPVTARSPRSMIAAFSRAISGIVGAQPVGVVQVHVRDRRDAAVPGMGRVEPPAESHLDDGEVEADIGEMAEDDRRQQLELGRRSVAPRHAVRRRHDLGDEAREVGRPDRPAVDHDPLAVRHEMRLGCLADAQPGRPERAPGECEHAALAVRPGHQRAAHGQLRVAELAQQRARPPEAQADRRIGPEPRWPAARRRRRGRRPTSRPCPRARHSRVSSSS